MPRHRSVNRSIFLCLAVLCCPGILVAQDFYVDGISGINSQSRGWSANLPCKTMSYGLGRITAAPPGSYVMHVAGGQTYSQATNGESFPLSVPPYMVIRGEGLSRPVVTAPPGTVGFECAPSWFGYGTDRTAIFENLDIRSGSIGIDFLMGNGTNDIQINDCSFEAQSRFGVHFADSPLWSSPYPRVVVSRSSFLNGADGLHIEVRFSTPDSRWTVTGCDFATLSGTGVTSFAWGSDPSNVVVVTQSRFTDSQRGVLISGGWSHWSSRDTIVSDCHFLRCAGQGLQIVAPDDQQISVQIRRNEFASCGTGIWLDYQIDSNDYARVVRVEDNLTSHCTDGLLAAWYGFPSRNRDSLLLSRNRHESCQRGVNLAMSYPCDASGLGERMTDCTVGILVQGADGILHLDSSILDHNTACGLQVTATNTLVTCSGSTFADQPNQAINLGNIDPASAITHCIFDNQGSDITSTNPIPVSYSCFAHQTVAGTGNLSMTDPQLDRTYFKLLPTSPCIDAGSVTATLAATDFEGDPRTIGARPDLGADEYAPAGTVRTFGVAGLGLPAMSPQIRSPDSSLRIGTSLTTNLAAARDVLGTDSSAALLLLGIGEGSAQLPRSLELFGAPASMLWIEPVTILGVVGPIPGGNASLSTGIPNRQDLVGCVVTAQWVVVKPGANALGMVTTNALRASIGQ